MIYKAFRIILITVCFGLILKPEIQAQTTRPNIVVVLLDDLGYADVGFNGATDIPTPTLDDLAEKGTIFSSAYVSHPFCGPSRVSIMTGRYAHAMGTQYNHPYYGEGSDLGVPTNEELLGTMLQREGYYTGLVGKWHLGKEDQFHPNNRGFDDFYGFLGGGHNYFPEQFKEAYQQALDEGRSEIFDYLLPLQHNGEEVDETEYVTDGLTREGVRFIKEATAKAEPFFLFMSYNAPHTPLEAKEDDLAQPIISEITDEARKTYAAMVYSVDRGMKKIVDALKEQGIYDNTLIVFFSDNGGRTDQGASNFPLKGAKGNTREGGIRVPMFMHWPGQVPANTTYEFPVSALDLYPTFAHLANHTIDPEKQLDGKNIWSSVINKQDARKGEYIYSLRHRSGFNEIGVRRDNWKLYRWNNGSPWLLYDMNTDPGENSNISGQHPELVDTMINFTRRWTQTHYDPFYFDSQQAKNTWVSNNMPDYDLTFSGIKNLEIGVPLAKGPVPVFTPVEDEILDILKTNNFVVYPNPVHSELSIRIHNKKAYKPISITVSNVSGQIVLSNPALIQNRSGLFTFNVEHLVRGKYFLRITSGNNIYNQPFIVQ